MLVLGLLSAALGANVFTLPALVVDGGGIVANKDVCLFSGICLSDAGGNAGVGAGQWKQDSVFDLTPVDAGPIGITVAAVDAGAGTIDATQYCIQGSTCLTSWPSAGGNQWLQDSALDYTPIDAGIGVTVAAVDAGEVSSTRADNTTSYYVSDNNGGLIASAAGHTVTIQGSLLSGAGQVVIEGTGAAMSGGMPLLVRSGGASEVMDINAAGSEFLDAGGTLTCQYVDAGTVIAVNDLATFVGAAAVDGGFGVFSTLWSALSLGTFGGFGSIDAGVTVVTILNDTGQVGAPAVDGGFGVFSTLWSALSLGTFGGFGSIDAGPVVFTTENASTSNTSPLTLGAFGGFADVDAGVSVVTPIVYATSQVSTPILICNGAASNTNGMLIEGSVNAAGTVPAVTFVNQAAMTTVTQPVYAFRDGPTQLSEIVDIMPNGSMFLDAGGTLTCSQVDAGTVIATNHLGSFVGSAYIDAGAGLAIGGGSLLTEGSVASCALASGQCNAVVPGINGHSLCIADLTYNWAADSGGFLCHVRADAGSATVFCLGVTNVAMPGTATVGIHCFN